MHFYCVLALFPDSLKFRRTADVHQDSHFNMRFPRHFVCHQVNFMQPFFPDFAYSANVRYIELAIGSQVLNAGEFGYKTPQCIQN